MNAEEPFEIVFWLVTMVIAVPLLLLPSIASVVFLWLCFRGRFSAPKTCPRCGADLKGPTSATDHL